MTSAAIVILNYNGRGFLADFLPTLIEHADGNEIIVADNASTDDSCDYLNVNFPAVRLIELDKNYGFAEGYNQALKQISTEYYAIINSDIEVTSNWIQPLVNFLNTNSDYVAVQPKILSYHDRTKFEYAGAAGGLLDQFGYPFCRGRIFEETETDQGQYDEILDVCWTSGACMVIKSEVFWEVGGFDGDFFAHMEEIDLCWRLKSKGYQLACIPDSKVFHVGGGTLSKQSAFKTYLNFRNGFTLLIKNLPVTQFWKLPIRLILDIGAGFLFWKNYGFNHLLAVLKALSISLVMAPRSISKRLHPSDQKKAVTSIAYQYYVKGCKKYTDLNQ
ncbi:MAG: glycosyltransferase family 2 protein [Cyclobacteriaceae bacterium]